MDGVPQPFVSVISLALARQAIIAIHPRVIRALPFHFYGASDCCSQRNVGNEEDRAEAGKKGLERE
jgi:hypothetical protein